MTGRETGAWQHFRGALRQQRAGLASALIVAVILVGLFHAPPKPVLVGCGLALVVLLARAGLSRPRA